MISAYRITEGRLQRFDPAVEGDLRGAVWIDLANPGADEEGEVEAALGLDIPTREDMQEIELSSRLYAEQDALFLTAQVLATHETAEPELGPVTFVLTAERLVTVRYHAPRSLAVFAARAAAQPLGCLDGKSTLLALLDTLVDRLADIVEGETRRLGGIGKSIFSAQRRSGTAERLEVILQRIGRAEDLNSQITESLATIERVVGYLSLPTGGLVPAVLKGIDKRQLKTLMRDVKSLQEIVDAQERKILFQLDATLGVISIRQSDIIRIYTVLSALFLPPMLIASIYGMNFATMPELGWRWGYAMAVGAMAGSALLSWALFRWKKWL